MFVAFHNVCFAFHNLISAFIAMGFSTCSQHVPHASDKSALADVYSCIEINIKSLQFLMRNLAVYVSNEKHMTNLCLMMLQVSLSIVG